MTSILFDQPTRPGIYLISAEAQDSVDRGQILDRSARRLYPPQSLVALTTRGESWESYTGSQAILPVLLASCTPLPPPAQPATLPPAVAGGKDRIAQEIGTDEPPIQQTEPGSSPKRRRRPLTEYERWIEEMT